MNIINNNIPSASCSFGSFPYYKAGHEVNKAELMGREAEYSRILEDLEGDTFEPAQDRIIIREAGDETEEVALKFQDIEAARKAQEIKRKIHEGESVQQVPHYSSVYAYGPHILDVKV